MTTFKILATSAAMLSFGAVNAAVTMPKYFSDNMVLQADTTAMLRGHATPGALVQAAGSWGGKAEATADKKGAWQMYLPTPKASFEPLSLTVTDTKDGHSVSFGNVLAGEVWIASGQSNMEMPLRGYNNQPIEGGGEEIVFSSKLGKGIRFLTIPKTPVYEPQYDVNATWKVSEPANAGEFSAVAWFFAKAIRDIIDTPVGIICNAYGGAKVEGFEPAEIIAKYPDRNMKAEQADKNKAHHERVGVMYYGMVLPVVGYTARGFIWNQGESNVGGHDYYGDRQADMVNHWRKMWGNDDMKFYFVELPGWDYGDVNGTNAALFREAQNKAATTTPGAYIVCTSDLVYPDEPNDIHARNKRSIGNRLAQSAATHTYGIKGIPHTYPTFREMEVKGNEAYLKFDNAWTGFSPNDAPEGFEVAGADKVFHPADARILPGEVIVVSSPDVREIKSVRYCFRNFAIGKLHDNYGMPLVPFRTDDWEK